MKPTAHPNKRQTLDRSESLEHAKLAKSMWLLGIAAAAMLTVAGSAVAFPSIDAATSADTPLGSLSADKQGNAIGACTQAAPAVPALPVAVPVALPVALPAVPSATGSACANADLDSFSADADAQGGIAAISLPSEVPYANMLPTEVGAGAKAQADASGAKGAVDDAMAKATAAAETLVATILGLF